VLKALSPSQAAIGDIVTFTLTVTNSGTVPATNVVITDTVVSFLDLISGSTTSGTITIDPITRTATANLGTVDPGEVIVITLVTRVNSSANVTADVTNTGTLTHDTGGPVSSEVSNTVRLRILGPPVLPNTGEAPLPNDGGWLLPIVGLVFGGLGMLAWGYGLSRAARNRRTARAALAGGMTFLLLGLGLECRGASGSLVGATTAHPTQQAYAVLVPTSTQEPTESFPDYPTPTPAPTQAGLSTEIVDSGPPVRLLIPSLQLDTLVAYIPFDGLTWPLVGLRQEVAWLGGSSLPGVGGNVVLAGHITLRGPVDGPFRHLEALKSGDEVTVHTERFAYLYRVREQYIVDETEFTVIAETPTSRLTLLTCASWDPAAQIYRKRRVLTADLVRVDPLTLAAR
jgi:LPXTG-site transpeptidase (sortase) family protein